MFTWIANLWWMVVFWWKKKTGWIDMGETIEVRGGDFGAVADDIGEAHVVGHDEDDVRLARAPGLRQCKRGGGGSGHGPAHAVHARVAVAIRDGQVTAGRERQSRWAIESRCLAPGRDTDGFERDQKLTLRSEPLTVSLLSSTHQSAAHSRASG